MNVTQRDFDVKRYLGTWYEVAKKPFPFEKGCDYSVANYTWESDILYIKNSCLDENRNVIRESFGKARIPDMNDKGKLKVKFSGPEAWPGEGDYYVHYTDYDKYSIVGGPNGRFLWILSRTKKIPKSDLLMLIQKVKSFGYNPDKILSNKKFLH